MEESPSTSATASVASSPAKESEDQSPPGERITPEGEEKTSDTKG